MKSEERHEIETNELAKMITGGSDKVAPYASYIIYGLLAIAAVWAILRLTSGSLNAKQMQKWDAYTIATLPGRFDAEQLKATATEYAGDEVGELAQIAWADSQLALGCQNFFTNKKQAMGQLDTALEEYKKLAASAQDKNLRGRAQLGVAKSLEAKGEITEAIAAYEKVTGAFSEMGDERAKNLVELDAAKYAGWLASAEGATRPTNFGAGSRPDFSADPLNLPGSDPAAAGVEGGEDFLEMLRRFQETAPDNGSDRYDADATGSSTDGDAMDSDTADSDADAPADESSADESTTDNTATETTEIVKEETSVSP